MNDYENNDNPSDKKRERIIVWKEIAAERCTLNDTILEKAVELQDKMVRPKDALHIASAIEAQCHYFITRIK